MVGAERGARKVIAPPYKAGYGSTVRLRMGSW